MFKVVAREDSQKSTAVVGSLLDELVRDGARQMLAAALQAEVAAYVEQFATFSTRTGTGSSCAMGTTSSGMSRPGPVLSR